MAGVILLALAGLTSIFVIVLLMQVMRKVEGVGTSSLVGFIPTLAFGYQGYLIPVACLTAAALAYGRLAGEREALALYAGGVSPWKLLVPALVVGLVMCLPASFANFVSGPDSYNEHDRLKRQALADVIAHPPPGRRSLSFPRVKICYRDYRDGNFEGLVILETGEDGNVRRSLTCTRAALRYSRGSSTLTLLGASDATVLNYNDDGRVQGVTARLHLRRLDEELPVSRTGRISFKAASLSELFDDIARERTKGPRTPQVSSGELARRVTFSLSPLFFALIGALTGLLALSRNRLMPVVLAVVVAGGLFYPLTVAAGSMVTGGVLFGLGAVVALPVVFGPLLAVIGMMVWRLQRL